MVEETEGSLTSLILGEQVGTAEGGAAAGAPNKWNSCVAGSNRRYIYCIPHNARRVVKFDSVTKTLAEIGPDFGDGGYKWMSGALAASDGCIYCPPLRARCILRINTLNDEVEELQDVELPENCDWAWNSATVAYDNCLYAMPYNSRRILKFDLASMTASSIGEDLGGGGYKYDGTVVGMDGWLYGIPHNATRIVKIDLANPERTFIVAEEGRERGAGGENFWCKGGVLADDGSIYSANIFGQVLKIDTHSNSHSWIDGKTGYEGDRGFGWGTPIIGVDASIYWVPYSANRVLKLDVNSMVHAEPPRLLLVGDDMGLEEYKWMGGALASDGNIYAMPSCARNILVVDPFKELLASFRKEFQKPHINIGAIFARNGSFNELSFYESSIQKFGFTKVFECIPSDEEWRRTCNLPLFFTIASLSPAQEDNDQILPLIYYLLTRNVNGFLELLNCML